MNMVNCAEKQRELNINGQSTCLILSLPYPTQGHAIPLVELSQHLVKHGLKVTFVNREFDHKQGCGHVDGEEVGTRFILFQS
ncbi:hypothetical protein CK203_046888 [Vitis vinifera]|uniref:Uncharacterized protein n=1 Tax=Vitis vinifera TaxID=29760 RepID=A0A438HE48_VITVI|nr:hypothetical protein CK203_046888 [Vitis vinifera]